MTEPAVPASASSPSASSLFRRATTLDALNALSRDTAIAALGVVFTEIGPDYLRASMPVDTRTLQPYGLLHGGASVAPGGNHHLFRGLGGLLIVEQHARAGLCKKTNAGGADASRAAGDQRGFAGEIHCQGHERSPLRSVTRICL
jgi:hypothetical protein